MIGLQLYHRVFTLGNRKVFTGFMQSQCIDLASRQVSPVSVPFINRIQMDGNKQVGIRLIGDCRPFIQLDVCIIVARIYHLYFRKVLFNQPSKLLYNGQGQRFLIGLGAYSAIILSSMSGIKGYDKVFRHHPHRRHRNKQQKRRKAHKIYFEALKKAHSCHVNTYKIIKNSPKRQSRQKHAPKYPK